MHPFLKTFRYEDEQAGPVLFFAALSVLPAEYFSDSAP